MTFLVKQARQAFDGSSTILFRAVTTTPKGSVWELLFQLASLALRPAWKVWEQKTE